MKEEILESLFVNLNQWNEKIILKATKYHSTQKVKTITATGKFCALHGIRDDEIIKIEHLCAILSYCDWSKLCTHFSNTFRKKNQFETLKKMKKRNSKYFFLVNF
eukprot:464910_1